MAKQNINIGSSANKGDGDPLRTAFTKINSNFTELYDAIGLGDGSVNLGSLEFSGSTITTTDSSRIEIAQEVRITSDLTMRGSIVPNIDNHFDLGSPTNQWRSLYVSNDTIFIGGVPLAVDNQGNLTVDGSPVSGGGGSTLVNGEFVVGLQVNGSLLLPTGDYQENQSRYQGAIVSENESSAIYMDVQTNSQDNVYGGMRLETWNSVPIDIRTRAGGQGDAIKNWRFDSNGSITFPDSTVQTTAWTGIADYNNLINKPNLAGTYQFSVAADDSTQRVISTDEVIKFIGAGGITTASDAEGNITITGSGGSVSSLVNGAYTVSLGSTGTLTVPANGIITAPIAQEFQLQAKDANSVLRNEINLDPNNGTYMSVWSDQTTSFSFNDWDTGSWNNESGLGAARFTDAQALQDFWTTGPGSLGLAYEASINGGARTPNVFYDGNNGETYGVTLGLDAVPPGGQGTTIPITSLVFYYRTQSKINIDVDGGEILLDAQSMDLDLRTTNILDLRANQNLNLRGLGAYPVRIYTDDTTHKWEFDNTGSLTLPRDGKIYGIGAGANDRLGYISWDGESSGDGSGFNTMRLVPDLQGLEDLDQYIIIDPTGGVPGHIHIRAGGTQDNSLADLYLGGEHSHVKISAGLNPPVTVMANDNSWTFGTDGSLTIPGDIRSEGNINIDINLSDSTLRRWQFGEDGNLEAPGIVSATGLRTSETKIALGSNAGQTSQGIRAVAVGAFAGQTSQGAESVAIGYGAGAATQGFSSVAVGNLAGSNTQGNVSVAVGDSAGQLNQSYEAVAVGFNTGLQDQGTWSVAIGSYAGAFSQGEDAIAIGRFAGQTDQPDNTIILNASGSEVNGVAAQTNSFYVAPIRNIGGTSGVLQYNAATKEVSYSSDIRSEGNINIEINLSDSTLRRWQFGEDGDLTFPDNTVQTTAYVPEDNLVKVSGEWAVTAGTNTYSFTVPADGTYIMWVKGNIPNGIITWNATASVSNTNVPAIGTQYAWNYTGGGSPILLTSIPDQIKGVAGTISTDNTYVGSTSNRFDFGISNTSGSTQTIYYGYTKIS